VAVARTPCPPAQLPPFEAQPIAFATYLGKEALVEWHRASFQEPERLQHGQWATPKEPTSASRAMRADSPSGSRNPCKAVSREGATRHHLGPAGKTGRRVMAGNLECPSHARRRCSARADPANGESEMNQKSDPVAPVYASQGCASYRLSPLSPVRLRRPRSNARAALFARKGAFAFVSPCKDKLEAERPPAS